jgi:hypothetical protein
VQMNRPRMMIDSVSPDRVVSYRRSKHKNDSAVERLDAAIQEFGLIVAILALRDGAVIGHLPAQVNEEETAAGSRKRRIEPPREAQNIFSEIGSPGGRACSSDIVILTSYLRR